MSSITAALLPDPSQGTPPPIAQAAPAAAAPRVALSLPADKLAVGDYQLQVTLMDTNGQKVHSAQKRLRKLPPAPNGHEWRFDEHNVLLHNGEPFLPFGWFSQDIRAWDPKDGYTALHAYGREYSRDDELRAWMDPIAATGAYVTFTPYSPAFMNRDIKDLQRPLNDRERQALTARVNALRDHPALLAWYLFDEPELRPVLPQRAQEIYETVRDADPYHPCIMLNDTIAGIYRYERGGDVLMPDPYPKFLHGSLAASPLEKTSKFMLAVKDATGGRKPAWVTPQAFNYGDRRAGNRAPTLTEVRNQNYQAVVHGAKGFLWYWYPDCHQYPDLYLGMPFLAREMADLKVAVLADDVPGAVTVTAAKPEHLHVSLRQVGGELVLFAVNTATEPQEATLTVKGAPAGLSVVSEGRTVTLANGSFTDRFGVYEAHVYATRGTLAGREQLADIRAAIARDNAARKKPGNLAFEDCETRVVVSSGAQHGNQPDRTTDGITKGQGWLAKEQNKTGEWLQVIWPAEQTIGRVVAYTTSIQAAEVQVPAGADQWKTVGTLSGKPLTARFEPVNTVSIRILITALLPEKERKWGTVQEVEAYAE